MNDLLPFRDFGLMDRSGVPMVSSRAVAQRFGKLHNNVLRDIENLQCSQQFTELNFELSYYHEGKGKYKEVLMTRDGFTFLAMGFTGKKAAQWKEQYITAFNQMETYIKDQLAARLEYRPMTDAIQAAHDPAKFYHYSTENDMIYRIVLGMSSKQFREQQGFPEAVSPKAYMTPSQINLFIRLQRSNTELITMGWDYARRKDHLAELAEKIRTPRLKAVAG